MKATFDIKRTSFKSSDKYNPKLYVNEGICINTDETQYLGKMYNYTIKIQYSWTYNLDVNYIIK